jgi:hypothetical protein
VKEGQLQQKVDMEMAEYQIFYFREEEEMTYDD